MRWSTGRGRRCFAVEAIGIAEKVSGLFIRTGDRTRSPERTDHENGSDSVPGTSAAAAV
jgi:hypothetical protein